MEFVCETFYLTLFTKLVHSPNIYYQHLLLDRDFHLLQSFFLTLYLLRFKYTKCENLSLCQNVILLH